MSHSTRRDGSNSRPRGGSAGSDLADAARSHLLRTARALIGTTPAQLASHIGAIPRCKPRTSPDRPVKSFDDLGQALHVIIGWYQDNLGNGAAKREAMARGATSLDEVVRQYLALRSEWEGREAISLANQMSAEASLRRPATISRGAGAASHPHPARQRALLVDDSADILVTVGSFLEAFGFDVVSASNADVALDILGRGQRIDLLVTDHAMPGMTGRDLALQACQTYEGLRALIITGYPDARELSELPARIALLAKPFRRAEFSTRIRALMETEARVGASELIYVNGGA